MLVFLLCLTACIQVDSFDLEKYLREQGYPVPEKVIGKLGPLPTLDELLDPAREKIEHGPLSIPELDFTEQQKAQLEEFDTWDEEIKNARGAQQHLDAARWAGRQAYGRAQLLGQRSAPVARSLHSLSRALSDLYRNEEARDVTLLALDITLDVHGRNHLRTRIQLEQLAACEASLGHHSTSRIALFHALDIATDAYGPVHRRIGNLWNTLAASSGSLARNDETRRAYQRSLEVHSEDSGPRSNAVAIISSNFAQFLIQSGYPEGARERLVDSLSILQELGKSESRAAVSTMFSIADLSPPAAGLEHLEKAMAIARKVMKPGDALWPGFLSSYGWALAQAGEHDRAETALRQALKLATEFSGPASSSVGEILNNLAGLLRMKGQYRVALKLYQQAFDLRRRLLPENHPSLVTGYNNLAAIYLGVGQYAEAEAALQKGLTLSRQLFPGDHEETARLLGALGALQYKTSRYAEAEENLQLALEMRREVHGSNSLTGHTAAWLALTLLALGDPDEAENLALEATDIHRENLGKRGLGLPGSLQILTQVYLGRGQHEEAYETSKESFEIVDARRGSLAGAPTEMAQFAQAISHGRLAAMFAHSAILSGRVDEAFFAFERARGRLLLKLLNQSRAKTRSWSATRPGKLATIQSKLKPGERIAAYFWTKDSLIRFSLGADEIHATVLVSGQAEIDELTLEVSRYARLVSDPKRSEGQSELAQRLAETLWGKEESEPDRWIILPDGPLRLIPFESLPLGGEAHRKLAYASSATLYIDRCQVAAQQDPDPTPSLIVLGDAVFSSESQLEPLPATRSEALCSGQLVRRAGGRSELLLGQDATLAALQSKASDCTLLHLATHGRPGKTEDPLAASLSLTAAKDSAAELTLRTLLQDWHGRLARCHLVVLSACETERPTRVGDSMMALSWGFFYAGAPTVIASLWKVDDRATALLMGRFYGNFLGDRRLSKLEALSEAKRWLASANRRDIRSFEREIGLDPIQDSSLRSPGSDSPIDPSTLLPYSDPAFWAGFLLVGSPD